MTDLVSRLLEAIEETERLAQGAGEPDDNWEYRRGADVVPVPKDGSEGSAFDGGIAWHPGATRVIYAYWEEDLEHVVHHKPSSVLRRCAADRRTVEEWMKQVENPFNGLSHDPPYFIRNLADGYGITDHQEGEA